MVRLHYRHVVEEDLPLGTYLVCISMETWGESWGVLVLGGALPTRRKSVDKRGPRPPPCPRTLDPFTMWVQKLCCAFKHNAKAKATIYKLYS